MQTPATETLCVVTAPLRSLNEALSATGHANDYTLVLSVIGIWTKPLARRTLLRARLPANGDCLG